MTTDPYWIAAALAGEVVSVASLAHAQRSMLAAAGSRVGRGSITTLAYAANALNATLPGGSAVAAGYTLRRLRSHGVPTSAAGFALLASSALSTVAFTFVVLTWAATSSGGGAMQTVLLSVGTSLAACLAVVTARCDRLLRPLGRMARVTLSAVNRVLRRPAHTGVLGLTRFVTEFRRVRPQPREWLIGMGWAAAKWIADLGCLVASCHAVGFDDPSVHAALAAFIAAMSASSFTPLPGGLGVADVAMIAILRSGAPPGAPVVTAVVCYRLITVGMAVAVGWVLVMAKWIGDRRLRREVECDETPNAGPDTVKMWPVSVTVTVPTRIP
jgi:uncharacterized protein (TIRG00374 family)